MADSCRTISIINYKGGVGKTTISLQLALGLASLHQKRVLMLDLDPQCSLSVSVLPEETWISHIENRGSVRSILSGYFEGNPRIDRDWIAEKAMQTPQGQLDLVPCHLDLPDYEMRLVSERPPQATDTEEFERSRHHLLRDAIEPLRKEYDYIICDCPPNIYFVARSAILASDYYLVPTIPDFLSCYGIPFIENHIQTLLHDLLPERQRAANLGIVRNRVRRSGTKLVNEHERQSKLIAEMYPELLFDVCIQDRIGISEIMGQRKNIFADTTHRLEPIREELQAFVSEALQRMETAR